MKKRIKRRRFALIRPVDGLLPLAFLAGELFGPPVLRGWVFAAWLTARASALFTADSVRMAYATQPGMRQVKGSTTLALILQMTGAGLIAGTYSLLFHGLTPFTLALIGIGLMLNIEHVFYEYLRAEGDKYSANICGILCATLLVAGIMLETGGVPLITLVLTGVSCAVSIIVATISGGYRPAKLNFGPVKHAPRAVIYGLTYPLVIGIACYAFKKASGDLLFEALSELERQWLQTGLRCGFFAGYGLMDLSRTPFRRSGFESRRMWPVLTATAAAFSVILAVCLSVSEIAQHILLGAGAFSACMVVSSIVSLGMWGNFKKER